MGFIDLLEKGPVRDWYIEHWDSGRLDHTMELSVKERYVLDRSSGLFIRDYKGVGHTVIDILTPRPVDLHYHEDVGEAIAITGGQGFLYAPAVIGDVKSIVPVQKGDGVFIPTGKSHTFSPKKGMLLEVSVVCTRKLDPAREVLKNRFNEFEHWKKIWEN